MDNNNFNELLLHTLKQLGIRLDRVDDRLDRIDDRLDRVDAKLDRKADKEDLKHLERKLDVTNEAVKSQGNVLIGLKAELRRCNGCSGLR